MTGALLLLAKLAGTPLRLLRDHPWQAACLVLALGAWWQHERAADWREQAEREAASHVATKTAYLRAQNAAAVEARAARLRTEQRYALLAKEADDAHEDAAHWRARAQHFAAHGGLHAQARTGPDGTPGPAGTTREDHAAACGERPCGAAVTLTREDFDTLSANTERLLRVHAWGARLIAEGLAHAPGTQDE